MYVDIESSIVFLHLYIHPFKKLQFCKVTIPCPKREWVSIFLLLTYFRGKSGSFKGSANIIKNL